MSKRLYNVVPTPEQKERLEAVAYTGSHPVRQIVHARALLKAAAGMSDPEISEALDFAPSNVAALRKRFSEEGLEACLARREQKNRFRKITGDVEARIARIACTPAPDGRSHWTLDLLTARIVELGVLPAIGRSAVGEVLKKTRSNPGSRSASASRPRRTASL